MGRFTVHASNIRPQAIEGSGRASWREGRAQTLGDRSCGAMRGKEFCPKEKEIQRAEQGLRSSRLRRPIASNRDQNLLSHFGEAGTAVLAVKQVEYGGHENPRLIITVDVPRDRFRDHHR
jgi:hypothetical protein